MSSLAFRVAARYLAATTPSPRKKTRDMVDPINRPKGISRSTLKDYVETEKGDGNPDRKDLRPEDVFSPKPNNMNVRDYVTSGWPGTDEDYKDMSKALDSQIPKDKGHDSVSNLSQYLLETQGGGGAKPVGVKT